MYEAKVMAKRMVLRTRNLVCSSDWCLITSNVGFVLSGTRPFFSLSELDNYHDSGLDIMAHDCNLYFYILCFINSEDFVQCLQIRHVDWFV